MEGAVLCVAGRGPLNDGVADMFAQLLPSMVWARAFASRFRRAIDHRQPRCDRRQLIVMCYVDIGGTPAHLRYLLRRLRKHAPDARSWSGSGSSRPPGFSGRSVPADDWSRRLFRLAQDGVVRAFNRHRRRKRPSSEQASVVTLHDQLSRQSRQAHPLVRSPTPAGPADRAGSPRSPARMTAAPPRWRSEGSVRRRP